MYEFLSIQAEEANSVTEPVTVSDAKAWANIDHTDDDALLTDIVKDSRHDIEQLTGRKLVSHSISVLVRVSSEERFTLPYGKPSSVQITDEDDEAVDEDLYKVSGGSVKIVQEGTYKITYTVGESNAALNSLIKMLTAYRYNNRGDNDSTIPKDIQEKANKHRMEWL